jgi:hypothetical protein
VTCFSKVVLFEHTSPHTTPHHTLHLAAHYTTPHATRHTLYSHREHTAHHRIRITAHSTKTIFLQYLFHLVFKKHSRLHIIVLPFYGRCVVAIVVFKYFVFDSRRRVLTGIVIDFRQMRPRLLIASG